jgi:hypothetical protein
VVSEVTERLTVSNRTRHKCDVRRFNVKKLNDGEVQEHYEVKTSNRFVVSLPISGSENHVAFSSLFLLDLS